MKGKMMMNWIMEIMNDEGWIEKILYPRFREVNMRRKIGEIGASGFKMCAGK